MRIRIAHIEMGQGSLTGLAQLLAEELECDWEKVAFERVNPGQNRARNNVWRDQSTGGSRAIRGSHQYLRQAGAAAREMLVRAAAQTWGVNPAECSVSKGVIHHTASRRSTTFGAGRSGERSEPTCRSEAERSQGLDDCGPAEAAA